MLKVTIMWILVLICFNTSFSGTDYSIKVSNIEKVNVNTLEFDVYIKAQATQFELTSYQCAFTFNKNISDNQSFSFTYIDGTSQLTIIPEVGIGINNSDGEQKLTFASMPGSEYIPTAYIKMGRFRLTTTGIFNDQLPDINWSFSGKINTIITGSNFADITDSSSHSEESYDQLNILKVIASETTDSLTSPEKTLDGKGANDGDPYSRWAARPMPEYLIFDLGRIMNISQSKFSFYEWNNGRIYKYSILVSNDLNNWNEIVNDDSSSSSEWTTNLINRPARYVKLVFLSNNQGDWAGLWEAQIYGNSDTSESAASERKPLVSIPLKIDDGAGHSDSLFVGIDSSACDGLDSCLGEVEFPQPLNSIFSAWFNVPNSQMLTLKDFRYGSLANNFVYTYQLQFQRGNASKIIVHWNLPIATKLRVQDIITGNIIDTIFYPGADSITINNPNNFYKLNLTVTYLSRVLPDEVKERLDLTPKDFVLYQNYPNPFNPSTNIKYALPYESSVNITIYNTLGEMIKVFEQGIKEAGNHDIIWQANGQASGIYFCTLTAKSTDGKNNFRKTRKMMLLK